MNILLRLLMACVVMINLQAGCSKKNPVDPPSAAQGEFWVTSGNQSLLLQKQTWQLSFSSPTNNYVFIDIDSAQSFQSVDGFGSIIIVINLK